jgi:ABC-type sugar transport system substrate-binding protein
VGWGGVVRAEIHEELARHPELDVVFADAAGSAEQQAQLLEALLSDGLSAVVLLPIEQNVRPILERYREAGIPVVMLDNDMEAPALYRTLILADNRRFGRDMGEFFVEVSGGHVDVIELRGIAGTSAAQHRTQGFRQAIAAAPDVRVVASVDAGWQRDRAREEVARLLPLHPRVEGVFAHNDDMAEGAIEAAEAAGRAGRLLVTGIDAGRDGVQLVTQGRLAATLMNPSPGRPACAALLALLAGEPLLPRVLLRTSLLRSKERIRAWQAGRSG